MIEKDIQNKFDTAQNIIFLTGAGVSTPSGIPDYRSKNGLYTNDKTNKPSEYYLSNDCLTSEPEVFYEYMTNKMYYPDAKPNIIHTKQAEFTNKRDASVVTQNIDNLYNEVETQNLIEFHGNLYNVYCLKCGMQVDYLEYLTDMHHHNCGGILQPNIVLYGENLNEKSVSAAINLVSNADLIVIVGTSMRVYPFAGLIEYRQPNSEVIVINKENINFNFPFTMVKTDAESFFKELTV